MVGPSAAHWEHTAPELDAHGEEDMVNDIQ